MIKARPSPELDRKVLDPTEQSDILISDRPDSSALIL